jgi:NitT/TauT family transport system substrate-binding protein
MRRHLIALISAVALAAAGCGSSADSGTPKADGKDQVKVGAIPIVDVAPLYLGKQQGFFDKQQIDLAVTPTTGGAAAVPGVVSGQFTFAFGNVTSLLVARDKGLDLKVVANGVASTGKQGADFSAVLVKNDSPVRSAKDLAGKTVSVNNLRNIGDSTVRASVRKAGGDPAQVQFVELAFPDAPAQLAAGRVDAIWVVEPFVTQARSQGARVVAWNYVDAAPDLTVATYFTTEKVVNDEQDLVKRFTAAIEESLAYARSHPEQAREILKTYTQIKPEVIAEITLPAWPTEVNEQSVQTLADLALQDGLIKEQPDIDALLP